MSILNPVGEFFALDIGTTAIRIVQLSRQQKSGVWSLVHFGYAPIDPKIAGSDAPEDQRKLGEIILTAIGQSGIKTRDVVVNIPSNKTFATVVDLPKMTPQELKTNVKYQAEQFIPMPIDEVKLDFALLGDSPKEPEKSEVLLTSVANSFNEVRLDTLETLGLNVVAMEPDSIAMLRAILPEGSTGSTLIFDIGDLTTDIVAVKDGAPRLVRSVPIGFQSIIKAAMQNLNIEHNQAEQFIVKFGLAKDRLEGQVPKAIEGTLEQFVSEIKKSANFFQNRYNTTPITSTIVAGYGAVIPLFTDYIKEKTELETSLANPWSKVQLSESDRTKLAPVASQFGVAIGLAQRTKTI